MSAIDVHVFRDSVAKIVRALTDSNIKVRQQGMKAFVESDSKGRPISVTLPSIPDNAPADLLNAIQGFLDHEVSHVLHTDFVYSSKMNESCRADGDTVSPGLWNVVEDVYVEKAMAKRFSGSMVNIDNIQRYATKKMLTEGYAKLKEEGAPEAKLRSYLLPSAIRAAAGQSAFIDFMKDKWSVMGHMEASVKALGSKLANVNSTKDCWEVTKLIRDAIAPPKPPQPPQKSDPGKGDGGASGEKSDDAKSDKNTKNDDQPPGDEKGEKKGKPDKKPKQKPEPKDEEDDGEGDGEGDGESGEDDKKDKSDDSEPSKPEDESKGDEDGGKSKDKSKKDESEDEEGDDGAGAEGDGEDDSDSDGDGDSDDADDEDEDDEGDSSGSSGSSDGDTGRGEQDDTDGADEDDKPAKVSGDAAPHDQGAPRGGDYTESDFEEKDIEDLIDPSMMKSMDEMGAELIEGAIKEHMAINPGDYIPFSRDLDYVGPLPAVQQFLNMSLDKSDVAKTAGETSHVIQGEVERLFRARSASRWNPGQRKGKISRNALHRACIGDDRVFRQKIEAQNRDVAVELVIDCSGSMSGSKITYASIAAYMLATVLERINVPCEIVGFTTMSGPVSSHVSNGDWRAYIDQIHKARYQDETIEFARYAPICLYVFKDFVRRFDDTAKKTLGFLNCASGFMSGNVDGESIETAAMRLRLRKEKRKVMIVMSDGQPAADGDFLLGQRKLAQVVRDIGDSGMEIYGLGLLDESVRSYYPKCEVVKTAQEIPTKVLALIQQLLVS